MRGLVNSTLQCWTLPPTIVADPLSGFANLGLGLQYVAMHGVGTDPLNKRLRNLRSMARRDLLKSVIMAPLSLFGTLTHAPVAVVAMLGGRYAGIDAQGDTSVQATVRIISGFVSLVLLYPTAAFATAWATESPAVALPTMALLAVSGYAAATRPVLSDTLESISGSLKLLTKKGTVDRLRVQRARMQTEIRSFADANAPSADLRGWWRDPDGHQQIIKETMQQLRSDERKERLVVTPESIAGAGLMTHYIPLRSDSKRHPKETAVLSSKQWPGNKNALVWIPGRNDSFFHVRRPDCKMQ